MEIQLLLENLTNPALLFFVLGMFSVYVKSDLEIPRNSSKFISLYLLFSIGFKGGQALSHEEVSADVLWLILFGLLISTTIPLYVFLISKKRFGAFNAGALAAAYGSVSAVTFVTAVSFLEVKQIPFHGYMVAIMALMESPSIIVGLLLVSLCSEASDHRMSHKKAIHHALTNGSVLLILGSLFIGYLVTDKEAEGIKPFTNDLFKGFLAIFLLDLGIMTGKKLLSLFRYGWSPLVLAIIIPLVNGCTIAVLSGYLTDDISNRFLFAILAAGASYIAVPAAVKIALPEANPGLFIPMALGITFPVNITIGMPLYFYLVENF